MVIEGFEEWITVIEDLDLIVCRGANGFFAYEGSPRHCIVGRFYPDMNRGYLDDDQIREPK